MKKPKKESVATAIRLPRQTYEWLRKRPDGTADSIKRGLELLAIEEGADGPTRDFALLIFDLAREVELETGAAWHADPAAHRMFRRTLLRAISKWRPPDYVDNILEPVMLPPFQEREHATQPLNDADELGIALADMVLNVPDRAARTKVRESREKTLKDLVKLHQTRGEEGND